MSGWLRHLERLVLPYHCISCGAAAEHMDLCHDCIRLLPWNHRCCERCAVPLPRDGVCGDCLINPPSWERAVCPFEYGPPVDIALRQFKFRRQLAAGRVLTELMARHIASQPGARPDCLVPVPLHWRRRWLRRFDQAEEIANTLSARLSIPVLHACRRVHATATQTRLDARARRRNLLGAFRLVAPVEGLAVAIIDDVLTTGSTAAAVCRELRRGGSRQTAVWCVARAAPPPRK